MPVSSFQRHYPIIVEYWTTEQEVIVVPELFEEVPLTYTNTARMLNKLDMILSILSVCSNHLFFRYKNVEGTWTFSIEKDDLGEEINAVSSKWGLFMYYFPEMGEQLKITGFTDQVHQDVALVSHFPYYFDDPNLDADRKREITFPETIYMDIDSYLSQSEETRKVLDTAIVYAISAFEIRGSHKSLSVIASFTSVETMVNFEFRNVEPEKCETCGQLRFSVAKKYRDFLLKYIGDSSTNKKKFNRFYTLRSKIVHTGERFKTETLFNEATTEQQDQEFIDHLEIVQ